jgi:glutamyl-tRNA reductase
MSFVLIGLSHHTSPLELREQLHFPEAVIPGALVSLRKRLEGAGAVILSTCNRVELYAHHQKNGDELQADLKRFMSDFHGISEGAFEAALYSQADEEAVRHLFRVAASLDSLVVGEAQILGQVQDAYQLAQAEQATDKVISQAFQQAFSTAKKVRTHSSIAEGKVSVGSVAVDLAVSIFMGLEGKTVMVIGSGNMGRLTLKNLVSRGVDRVLVVNRSIEKAEAIAAEVGGEALPMDALETNLHRADIIVTSTASPEPILRPTSFQSALKQRAHEPIFIIDIAVPRDVDPAVNDLDDVYLYDVDDLQDVADENMRTRRDEIERCTAMVEKSVANYMKWLRGLAAEPTIVSMASELNDIRERELTKTLKNLPDLTQEQRDEVDYLSKRIVNAILQRPMSQIKREMASDDAQGVLQMVKRLFGLKEIS